MNLRQFAYRNVVRNGRIYAAFFMASVFSVMVFFMYSMLMFHPRIDDEFLREVAVPGMFAADLVLVVFMLFFLFYSMSAFISARTSEFGLLLQLGMERAQLMRLLFLETMLIGAASIAGGLFFGFAFTKAFFMIVRELIGIEALSLYISWKPIALTIGVFIPLFILISVASAFFIRSMRIIELLRGRPLPPGGQFYSTRWAYAGYAMLGSAYALAAFTSRALALPLLLIEPPLLVGGTYLLFAHSLPYTIDRLKRRKRFYWKKYRLITVASASIKWRESARMFFIVTIVTTLAFVAVGTLLTFASFSKQYRNLNPLGLIYICAPDYPKQTEHLQKLMAELESKRVAYELVPMEIKLQTSSATGLVVQVLRESDVNALAKKLKYPPVRLGGEEALLLPARTQGGAVLSEKWTVLEESNLPLQLSGTYERVLFPPESIGSNAIVVSDANFDLLTEPLYGRTLSESGYRFYGFAVPTRSWSKQEIGNWLLESAENQSPKTDGSFAFRFFNPGLTYSILRATFSLLLFIGLLVAAVFLLAAGSFIYFRLYSDLERDQQQFRLLQRIGYTDRDVLRLVNLQLLPQFFLPWSIALLHSAFAFLSLQVFWKEQADLSIWRDIAVVLSGFFAVQLAYFYLIRWRYLDHLREG